MVLRGVEHLAAVVLLMLVAVSAGVLLYYWLTGSASATASAERPLVRIEAVEANSSTLRVYVRNVGDTPVNITTIYLLHNGVLVAAMNTTGYAPPRGLAVVEAPLPPLPAATYTVRVAGTAGASASSILVLSSRTGWLKGWSYRIPIIFYNPSAVYLDYTVNVTLNATNFNGWSIVKPDGSDIRFTASDGVTLLPFRIVYWNPAARKAIITVNIGDLPPHSSKLIYMYYGNPSAEPRYYSSSQLYELIGEAGTININNTGGWVHFTVHFRETPVVIASIMTFHGRQPAVVRIMNLSRNGFFIRIEEYPKQYYWDGGIHLNETVGWIALRPGIWLIGGKIWVVGRTIANSTYRHVELPYRFKTLPAILTFIDSYNQGGVPPNPHAGSHTRENNPSTSGFDVKIEEQGDTPHVDETIGYVAVEPGTGRTVNGHLFEAGVLRDVEYVGIFGPGYIYYWDWRYHSFARTFPETPVIVFKIMTEYGPNHCHERMMAPSRSGFYYALQETPAFDGWHVTEWGGYIAIEPGPIYGIQYAPVSVSVVFGAPEHR